MLNKILFLNNKNLTFFDYPKTFINNNSLLKIKYFFFKTFNKTISVFFLDFHRIYGLFF